jgi:hypothetical protein
MALPRRGSILAVTAYPSLIRKSYPFAPQSQFPRDEFKLLPVANEQRGRPADSIISVVLTMPHRQPQGAAVARPEGLSPKFSAR